MKLLVILLLIASSVVGQTDSRYHIRVAPYGDWGYYVIHFTNDNWRTHHELMKGDNPSAVLFYTKQKAVAFARRFKTHKRCLDHNKRIINEHRRRINADRPVNVY